MLSILTPRFLTHSIHLICVCLCETRDKGDMYGLFFHLVSLISYTEAASNTHLLKTLQDGGCLGAALVNLLIERSREIEAQSVVLQVPVLQVVASASASKLKVLDLRISPEKSTRSGCFCF